MKKVCEYGFFGSLLLLICLSIIFVGNKNADAVCVQDSYGGQCVVYVRDYFGGSYELMPGLCQYNPDCGARNAWGHWDLGFGSGQIPADNSIMVMDGWPGVETGHMAVVINATSNVDGIYTLNVQESNWDLDELVDCDVTYTFYSIDSEVTREGGSSRYPILGFIYGHYSFPTRSMDFEDGVDRQPIHSNIPGMVFTTTQGYDWIYGDWRTGEYSGPYPNGPYYSNGNFFAWLGPNQGTGRIDFIGATATYLSVLTSTYSGLTMDAYDVDDNLLASSGWATDNLWTGEMTKLTVAAPNMAYVLVHDTGNYWLIDDLEIGDLLAEAKAYLPAEFIAEYEDIDTLDQDESKWKTFFNKIYQTIKIILGWGGSELSINIYNPNGDLYGEYQSNTSPIIIDIPNAEPGQWQFKITGIDVPENNYPFALVVGTCLNTPPTADAGQDQTAAVGTNCMANVTLDGSASSDPDEDNLTYIWTWDGGSATGINPEIQLPLGVHAITLIANDGTMDSNPDTVDITVIDQTPPEITLSVSPDTLWPPNHKMVLITPTITATDNCDPDPVIELISITMNEEEKTKGKGHTADDIYVDENGNIYLRAERLGTGIGRIYTITYTATDASCNSSFASSTVTVPHNKKK